MIAQPPLLSCPSPQKISQRGKHFNLSLLQWTASIIEGSLTVPTSGSVISTPSWVVTRWVKLTLAENDTIISARQNAIKV